MRIRSYSGADGATYDATGMKSIRIFPTARPSARLRPTMRRLTMIELLRLFIVNSLLRWREWRTRRTDLYLEPRYFRD